MEQIAKNLLDPSWWFTGIFFVLVGIVLAKLLFNWIPSIWRKLSSSLPEQFRKVGRWNRKRTLSVIKNYRQKDMKVISLIGRYWSLALLTTSSFLLIVGYFAISEDITIREVYSENRVLVLIPFYSLLLYLVAEKRRLNKVIEANHHWKRMTSNSTRTSNSPLHSKLGAGE